MAILKEMIEGVRLMLGHETAKMIQEIEFLKLENEKLRAELEAVQRWKDDAIDRMHGRKLPVDPNSLQAIGD